MNIWSEYKKIPLPELLSFVVDNRGKTVPLSEDGNHMLIATNCIRNENLYPSYDKIRFLSQDTYDTWFRAHPIPGDILFVCKGTPGRVCMVPDPIDFCIAQDMVALRVDDARIYNRYLLAVLRSRQIQEQITKTSVGDVIPHFKKQFFDQLLIPVPPIDVQKKLGDMYFAFSLKIEENKKINDNLLQQAQAIFGSLYDASTDRQPFTSLIRVLGGGTPKTDNPKYWNGAIPFFTPKDVGEPYAFKTEKSITDSGLANCNSRLYPVNTTFVTARGTVGKVSMAGVPMAMNQSCYALTSDSIDPILVYFYVLKAVSSLKHKASGAVFDAIVTRDFDTEVLNVLSSDDSEAVMEVIAPLMRTIHNNVKENIRLSSLRDTLLPRLMSGELDVSSVEL